MLNPTFKTLDEWEPVKSTKMDVCAKLCQYYLQRDDVPDVEFKDGRPIFPKIRLPQPGQVITQNRKLLIFAEFPSMTGLLRNVRTPFITHSSYSLCRDIKVLHLHGVDSLFINGNMSYERRARVVAQFHAPGSPRVLIFSSVGSAGLNLSIADRVIFFVRKFLSLLDMNANIYRFVGSALECPR